MLCRSSTIYSDPITLYSQLRNYRSQKYAMSSSGWILSDAADQMFRTSRERVFNGDDEFEPEPCPKWRALSELLRCEIPAAVRRAVEHNPNALSEPVKVLVLCQDARTCYQLNQYLTMGAERHLLYTALKHDVPITKISEHYRIVQEVDAATANIVLAEPRSSATIATTTTTTPAPAAAAPTETTDAEKAQSRKSAAAFTGFLRDRISKRKHDKTMMATQSQRQSASGTTKRSAVTQDDIESGALDNDDADDTMAGSANNNTSSELSMMLSAREDQEDGAGALGETAMFRDAYILTMTQTLDTSSIPLNDSAGIAFESFAELDNLDVTQVLHTISRPLVCIQTFKTCDQGGQSLERTLHDLQPGFVIMFHSSVTAIRQLEVFEAQRQRPARQRMHIFFLMHSQTVEEQAYLTSLRREKQAFELLIETKRTMVVPTEQDGRSDAALLLLQPAAQRACPDEAPGQRNAAAAARIIVDMREFRSELPCLIHRRGIEVVPVTITIGDYILTPEICVERKSISDLIGSLNSGRLYNQCVQMQRYYARPILLIEFDQNKPFHLQGHYMASEQPTSSGGGTNSNEDITQKLQLLTLHFPRLRLVWSPSPYATAQLFEEMKQNRAEPDGAQAAAHGADDAAAAAGDGMAAETFAVDRLNTTLYDFVLKLPGITAKNVMPLLHRVKDMKELLGFSEMELAARLGDHKGNAKMLWQILHETHRAPEEGPAAAGPFGRAFRRGMGRKF